MIVPRTTRRDDWLYTTVVLTAHPVDKPAPMRTAEELTC